MRGERIDLRIDIGVGKSSAKVWTCDLTKEYVASRKALSTFWNSNPASPRGYPRQARA
jgi:hypothetical protein